MSREGRKSGRSVTSEEADLWDQLTQSVKPAKVKPRVGTQAAPDPPSRNSPPPARKPEPKASRPKSAPPQPLPPPPRKPPALADFDRRAARQVASGKLSIDARIDLHGLRLRDAHGELRAFLFAAQTRGARTVLVITGKGGASSERDNLASALGKPQRGVLRHAVPQWLAEPDLRPVVLSFTTASIRHGGDGALYVQLRKGRQQD
jgi:DNA-nicking Smr family endonuclease